MLVHWEKVIWAKDGGSGTQWGPAIIFSEKKSTSLNPMRLSLRDGHVAAEYAPIRHMRRIFEHMRNMQFMRMMRIVNPILHRFQKINKMLLTGKCGTHMHPSHSKNSHMLPFLFYYLGGLGGFRRTWRNYWTILWRGFSSKLLVKSPFFIRLIPSNMIIIFIVTMMKNGRRSVSGD